MAYIGCDVPEEAHAGQLLICRGCKRVTEIDDPAITALLTRSAEFMLDP